MKSYMRRAAGKPCFYKLAEWDALNCCWRDGKVQFDSAAAATAAARKPGRYRLSFVNENADRRDLEPFEVSA